MDCNILLPPLDGVLLALVVEVESTIEDDTFVCCYAALNNTALVHLFSENNIAKEEFGRADLDEDVVLVVLSNYGSLRDGELLLSTPGEGHAGEFVRSIEALRVCDIHAHLDGTGGRVDDWRDVGETACDLVIRKSRDLHNHLHP